MLAGPAAGVTAVMALLIWMALAGAAPGHAHAEDAVDTMSADARAHYDRGLALYAAKDYPAAIAALRAGYTLDPRREFLFAEAQALRLSGDCKSAVPLYQSFLTSGPDEVQVNAAHIALGRCAAQMASAPPAAPAPAPRTPAPPTLAIPPRPPAAPPPWYQDLAGGALLGAGVLAVAAGAGFSIGALTARDDANQQASYPAYAQRWDTAHSRERIAVIAFAAGVVLTSAAVIRYVRVRARGTPPPGLRLDAWLAPGSRGGASGGIVGGGGSVGLGARF
jgi:tetratricopeptide (TPR) repeat protein